jgi:hypothetical protein
MPLGFDTVSSRNYALRRNDHCHAPLTLPAARLIFSISMEIELPADSRRVLNMILDNGSIRGFELRRMSGMACDALINAAKPLIDNRYVTASGVLNEDTLDGVRFAPLSSSLGAR